MVAFSRDLFPSVSYAYALTPTYPTGTIGFLICSLDEVSGFPCPLIHVIGVCVAFVEAKIVYFLSIY